MQKNTNILLKKPYQSKASNSLKRNIATLDSFGINSNAEQQAFFSVISHNIKNPFSTLLGFTELLFEDFDDLDNQDRKFYLNEIKKSADFTYKYIEKFFEWIYYKTGKVKLEFQPIKISELIEKVINEFDIEEKSIKCNIDENLTVYADSDSLEKMLYNLIDNAIKFTNKTPEIFISAKTVNNNIEISIKDNGIGILQDDIDKLFNITADPKNIGNSTNKGVGLGLILIKELITLNNGTISVKSDINSGSEFSLFLPNIEYLDF